MDAFAVAVSHGAARSQSNGWEAARIGIAFGLAQALMPLLGWALGLAFASIIRGVDHWVTFVLLALIGAKMAYSALSAKHAAMAVDRSQRTSGLALLTMSIATSIDAAAAGVTLPLLGQPVLIACTVIGVVTMLVSAAGVFIGAAAGALIGKRAELIGGLVLIGIGTRILIDHLLLGA